MSTGNDAGASATSAEDAPLLDTLDYIVLSVVAAALVAYVASKLVGGKKPSKKKALAATPAQQSTSTFVQEDDFVGKMKKSGMCAIVVDSIHLELC